jgi:hypothetical protein
MVVAGLSLAIHLLNLLQPPDGSEGRAAIHAAAAYLDNQSAGSGVVRRRRARSRIKKIRTKAKAASRAKAGLKATAADQHVLPP